MKLLKSICILGLGVLASSCQTTSYIANVDKSRKQVEVQSQSDDGSAVYALHKNGILNDVRSNLKTSLKENIKDVKSLLNLSQVYLAQGNYKKAEDFCRRALRRDLKNQDAKLILAQIYYRRGYTDMTEIILNSMGRAAEKNSTALNLKALVALKNDRPAYAMNFFKQSLKYNPGDIATRMNLGVLYVYYRQVDAASVQFERVLKSMPDHVDAKLHLGIIKASRGQYEQASDLYKDVLDVDPGNALATYNLAVLAEKQKDYDDSLSHLKSYLSSNYAKRQDNKEVFAMIERLRAKKDMMGETVSDSEIQEMSAQLDQPMTKNAALSEDEDVLKEVERPKAKRPAIQKEANPPSQASRPKVNATPKQEKKKEEPKPPAYSGDDIESLEKALIE
ncbi:tetratricopeptide repeat protein [Pseudobacteriovorax antillogorgiicola]|uniref:Tetratricopeptide repeat-containing protein n=1 Tax=Pseudobacteriovorax antillogorgiicola TaxID=1513793 RepID=A0A1Y6C5Q6_9BACT|nr:tetratricopeptide repeat protein [Pseudobacteriovorax antillogorgiicola]TCS49410.1 tetratricopeptide repeat protein [Pseudobacteriovorax antillogorgiicola]SMF46973.1 Tetratricopeptide repeat-containing protein [Pseudobacteriovorax antillogorgiicola]